MCVCVRVFQPRPVASSGRTSSSIDCKTRLLPVPLTFICSKKQRFFRLFGGVASWASQVLVDGVPLEDLDPAWFRDQLGIVGQDSLFTGLFESGCVGLFVGLRSMSL